MRSVQKSFDESAGTTVAPPRRGKTVVKPDDGFGSGLGWDSQVVLFNDDVNTFDHVIQCLMSVFGHCGQLAAKIALEAHTKGRAIAEVEPRERAEQHAGALRRQGLRATVESIG
jgi:ATP-dependent Clp protease adaptor protein ClpS